VITGSQESACCCGEDPDPPPVGERLEIKVYWEVSTRIMVYEKAAGSAPYIDNQYPHVRCGERTTTTSIEGECEPGGETWGTWTETPVEAWDGPTSVSWGCLFNIQQNPEVEWVMPEPWYTSYSIITTCIGNTSCLRPPVSIIGYKTNCPFQDNPGQYPIYGPGGGIWFPGPRTVDIESHLKLSATYALQFTSTALVQSYTQLTWPINGVPTLVNFSVNFNQYVEQYAGTFQAENRRVQCTRANTGVCVACPIPDGTYRTKNVVGSYGRTATYAQNITVKVSRTSATGTWTMAVSGGAIRFVKDGTTNYTVSLSGTLSQAVAAINAIPGLIVGTYDWPQALGAGPASEIQPMSVVSLLYAPPLYGAYLYLRRIGDKWESWQINRREFFSVGGAFGFGLSAQRPDSISQEQWQYGLGILIPDNEVCFPMWDHTDGGGFGSYWVGLPANVPARGESCCAGGPTNYGYNSPLDVPAGIGPRWGIRPVQGDSVQEFTGFTCNGNLSNPQGYFCGPCSESQRQTGTQCVYQGCQKDPIEFYGCILTSPTLCTSQWQIPCSKSSHGPALAEGLRYQWQIRRY
jgi:hypothetical protein